MATGLFSLYSEWYIQAHEWIKKEFVYSFEWEKDSIAIWDNWSILHQATPFSGNRVMHRITVQ